MQARQALRRVAGRQAPPGRAAGADERVSQSRELLYSVPAALCEKIARAATEELDGAAEHSGLGGFPATREPIFPYFCMFFCGVPLHQKW